MALTFLIALAALIIAILAYRRSGGATQQDLQRQVNDLRQKTADLLSKMEKSLRGEEKREQ